MRLGCGEEDIQNVCCREWKEVRENSENCCTFAVVLLCKAGKKDLKKVALSAERDALRD
ncbi:hypothetical protein HMPREF1869_00944 [Bacteroidales bacterium KA00251]|nr:hypothetical protein HMPREF1869_00944 [Bacteroidales bacterium KA00251]